MDVLGTSGATVTLVPGDLRRRVDLSSSDARLERARLATAEATLREARRAAAEARADHQAASASLDQRDLVDRKEAARREYRQALAAARDARERQVAAARWLTTVDQLNRATRLALGQVLLARARLATLEREVREAELRADAQRVRAETAEDATSVARKLMMDADPSADAIPTDHRSARVGRVDMPVLREMLEGGEVTRDIARHLAALTGEPASRWLLLLRTLVEIIIASAVADDRLRFDTSHPLWSQLSLAQARGLMHGLRDLGFRYDPQDGWYGERAPGPRDVALALAWAGIEAISLRPMPTAADLARLPASIGVAAVEHLAEHAPDLDLEALHRMCGPQALALADLWDHWTDVRTLLRGDAPLALPA